MTEHRWWHDDERDRRSRVARAAYGRRPHPAARQQRTPFRYPLTRIERQALEALQGGACALCEERPDFGLHVDHDHRTGLVRGLLCVGCNTAIGKLGDDADRLEKAAQYLRYGGVTEPLRRSVLVTSLSKSSSRSPSHARAREAADD